MTTLLAVATLLVAPPAWTEHAYFDLLVEQDWSAYRSIDEAEGRVVVRSESMVMTASGDGRMIPGINGPMQVGDVRTPISIVHFEDEPSQSAWLMQVSQLNTLNPQNAWFRGRIGPNTMREIINLMNALLAHYGEEGPMNDQGPVTVTFRNGNSYISHELRQTLVGNRNFSLQIQNKDWRFLKSQWLKLPGVKTD